MVAVGVGGYASGPTLNMCGKMVLADDSGLKVDALGGLPGVWSARFAGNDATDLENNAKLLHELAMVFDLKDRSAQFHTTLVVASHLGFQFCSLIFQIFYEIQQFFLHCE